MQLDRAESLDSVAPDISTEAFTRANRKPPCLKAWGLFLEHKQKLFMLLGPIVCFVSCSSDSSKVGIPLYFIGLDSKVAGTSYVAIWMGFYWMTEALPLAATALFPLVLFVGRFALNVNPRSPFLEYLKLTRLLRPISMIR